MTRAVLALLFAVLTFAALPAGAQANRTFPANALRGTLLVVAPPQVKVNGAPARLAPGARIRTQDNRIVLSAPLIGVELVVNYTLDNQGQVKDVWILTAAEVARQPWPATPAQAQAWQFDAAAQTWTRP